MPNTLTGEDVQHIAELARLDIPAEEETQLLTELNSILEFVGQLQQVDTTGVEPLAHPTQFPPEKTGFSGGPGLGGQQAREDEARPSGLDVDALLKAAPAREGRCVKVRAVFNTESADAS